MDVSKQLISESWGNKWEGFIAYVWGIRGGGEIRGGEGAKWRMCIGCKSMIELDSKYERGSLGSCK